MTETPTLPAVSIIHECPPPAGSGMTPCCDRTPFELPRDSRMATNPTLVTCPGPLFVVTAAGRRSTVIGPMAPELAVRHRAEVIRTLEAHGVPYTAVWLMTEVDPGQFGVEDGRTNCGLRECAAEKRCVFHTCGTEAG